MVIIQERYFIPKTLFLIMSFGIGNHGVKYSANSLNTSNPLPSKPTKHNRRNQL
jgi:hypothetical protein